MLELDRLRKAYGEVVALDHLSLTARPGRLLGFLGPNGAGKSTAMRAVFGLVRLDAGSVTWQGEPINDTQRRQFGYMPEQRGLYPRMPVAEQLRYIGELHGLSDAEARVAAAGWLEELGLTDRAGDPLRELSHGNQQRVQLAAALVHEPEVLVLDEPLSGLDPLGVAGLGRIIRQRAEDGATVVLSSHQLDLVEELCDDVVIVAEGRDRLAGDLAAIRADHPHREVQVRLAGGHTPDPPAGCELVASSHGVTRLRVPADTDPAQLATSLARQATVERFRFEPPSLEEIFRSAVGVSIAELEAEDEEAA
ncbi:MAG: ATP-binding cassette domain-containing protein [Nitriliruptor sp.]|nr:MAG: ATP-binding cassette domain-containing protein [Nitriliruptor sp.]